MFRPTLAIVASLFLVACGQPNSERTRSYSRTSADRVVVSNARDMRAARLSRSGEVAVSIVVHNAKQQPMLNIPVRFEIVQASGQVALLNDDALSDENGVATTVVSTDEQATEVVVHAEVEGSGGIDIEVTAEREPTPIDGQYSFTMQLEPMKLLAKPAAVAVDDVSRALIDPITFVLDGILTVDDHGNVRRDGLCQALAAGPSDIQHCVRDVGALLNALLDLAISQVADPAKVRLVLADAGLALKDMHLGGTLTLRTEEMKAGPLKVELSWDRLMLASGATIDLREANLSPFSAVISGVASERADGSGVDMSLDQAKVHFAYAELALAMVERIVLPKLLPSFDANADGVVTLAELFARLTRCDKVAEDKRVACEATAPALASLVESGILPRLSANLPKGFDVTMKASLTLGGQGGAPSLDATLVFAGVNGRSQAVPLQAQE